MRKDCGDAAEMVRKDYGSSADIVRTKCGTTACVSATDARRRSALLGHHKKSFSPRLRDRIRNGKPGFEASPVVHSDPTSAGFTDSEVGHVHCDCVMHYSSVSGAYERIQFSTVLKPSDRLDLYIASLMVGCS